jgi:predicted DNA binding CopG/RHH family protein
MINVKLTAPVFKKDEFGHFDRKADIQIAGDFESFSEGYTFLRTQIDELLQAQQADNTLLLNHDGLQEEIAKKERTLQRLNKDIEIAKNQLQRLQNFLQRLGIDPTAYSLLIANKSIELSTSSGVCAEVVDPIPFDLSDRDDSTDENEF